MITTLTYRYRVKDSRCGRLNAQARAVNFVWNYCNETQRKALTRDGRWLSANQLGRLCSGATKEGLDLSANTVEHICRQYAPREIKGARDAALYGNAQWPTTRGDWVCGEFEALPVPFLDGESGR